MLNPKKHIVIIGGGIIGLTSAYELSKHFKVTLVEKEKDVCLGTSFQNGGLVNVESIFPVNSYLSFKDVIKSSLISMVSNSRSNTFFHPRAVLSPNFLLWIKHFFKNTSRENILYHSEGMRQMGCAIQPLMEELFQDLDLDRLNHNFKYTPCLYLRKVDNPEALIGTQRELFDQIYAKNYLSGNELEAIKTDSGAKDIERYNFGHLEPNDITVNTRTLGLSLNEKLKERKVDFMQGEISEIESESNKITNIVLKNKDVIKADMFLVAAGYSSNQLLKKIGIKVPLLPVKAYSLHKEDSQAAKNWKYTVNIDATVAGLFTPYKEHETLSGLRITGVRDIVGNDASMNNVRLNHLIEVAEQYTGEEWRSSKVKTWCGIMPLAPDDFPIIGGTQKYSNLVLNVGHGFRGTAWSLPSARLLSQILTRSQKFCFQPDYASPTRFGI